MADTAVGLFTDSQAAESVVNALRSEGFEPEQIRTVAELIGASVSSATATPQVDFAASLGRDLRSMGATEDECEAMLAGIRSGNSLVFATGTRAAADTAVEIMNRYSALEVEEYAAAAPAIAGPDQGGFSPHGITAKEDRLRAKTTGAKIFSW